MDDDTRDSLSRCNRLPILKYHIYDTVVFLQLFYDTIRIAGLIQSFAKGQSTVSALCSSTFSVK